VIEAEEVKQAMNDEVRNVVDKRGAGVSRFVAYRLIREHDVAERARTSRFVFGRERQNIGRGILAAPRAVQVSHLGIISEKDSDLVGPLRARRSETEGRSRCSFDKRVGNRATPSLGMANDIDL
jgi:hypothetical protein